MGSSDVFLESAKLFNYCGMKAVTDSLFVVFSVTFFVTRLVGYPYLILKPAMFDKITYGLWPTDLFLRYLIYLLLGILQLLHIFWFSIITKMIIKFSRGEMDGDERSDDEEEEMDDHSKKEK